MGKVGKRNKNKVRQAKHYGNPGVNPAAFYRKHMIDSEAMDEWIRDEMAKNERPIDRPNINIRRNNVMEALELMLEPYKQNSKVQLRQEFVEALDSVVSGYEGEKALNALAKRSTKRELGTGQTA